MVDGGPPSDRKDLMRAAGPPLPPKKNRSGTTLDFSWLDGYSQLTCAAARHKVAEAKVVLHLTSFLSF